MPRKKPESGLKVNLYIDGASRGNPGPSSLGALILDDKGRVIKEISKPIGEATNNIAEYMAAIVGLQEALALGAEEAHVFTDSQLLERQLNGLYKVKEPTIQYLFRILSHLKGCFKRFVIQHIPREENRRADALANQAFLV